MNKETARFIISVCDFMNGYHGHMIAEWIHGAAFVAISILFFMLMMVYLS